MPIVKTNLGIELTNHIDKYDDIIAVINYYITPTLFEGYFSCDNICQIPHSRLELVLPFTINKDNEIDNVTELFGSFFDGEKNSIVKCNTPPFLGH